MLDLWVYVYIKQNIHEKSTCEVSQIFLYGICFISCHSSSHHAMHYFTPAGHITHKSPYPLPSKPNDQKFRTQKPDNDMHACGFLTISHMKLQWTSFLKPIPYSLRTQDITISGFCIFPAIPKCRFHCKMPVDAQCTQNQVVWRFVIITTR